MDILNQEIDTIEDMNQDIEQKCQEQEQENMERMRILQATPDEEKRRRRIQKVIDEKNGEVSQFQDELDKLQPLFQDLLIKLVESRFNSNPNRIHTYSEGFQLNESNIDSYLAEMEDFVNQILLYKSKKYQPQLYFTSTLLLEEIPYKDFKQKSPVREWGLRFVATDRAAGGAERREQAAGLVEAARAGAGLPGEEGQPAGGVVAEQQREEVDAGAEQEVTD